MNRRTSQELADLKEQATAMRMAGIGAKRIAKELRVSPALIHDLLRDIPVAATLTRPNARDATKAAAELLRADGRTYREIAEELGVSKSSLSGWLSTLPSPTPEQREAVRTRQGVVIAEPQDRRGVARVLRGAGWLLREIAEELEVAEVTVHRWVRDLPIPPRAVHGGSADEIRERSRQSWDRRRLLLDEQRELQLSAAAAEVPRITDEMLSLLAAVAYWCEGSKSKPWRRSENLILINSDADVIRLWNEWLRRQGVGPERVRLRLNIHVSGDVEGSTLYWSEIVGRPPSDFQSPTLKKHNPKTVRKNVGKWYHGCLVVSVLQSRDLYRQIEGTWRGIVAGL